MGELANTAFQSRGDIVKHDRGATCQLANRIERFDDCLIARLRSGLHNAAHLPPLRFIYPIHEPHPGSRQVASQEIPIEFIDHRQTCERLEIDINEGHRSRVRSSVEVLQSETAEQSG